VGVSENNGDGKVLSTGTAQIYWKQNYKAAAAANKICYVEGEGAVNERTAQRWFKRFASGNFSSEDEQRPG
jgi:hypothetical protein